MSKDKFNDKYRIESARAKWHDYDNGVYFITICTKNRECFFGSIQNNKMILSETGEYTEQKLQTINNHYLYAEILLWTIMPNHIHMILSIDGTKLPFKKRDMPIFQQNESSGTDQTPIEKATETQSWLSNVVCQFKQSIKRFTNQKKIDFAWQARFHDHIIRNQKEMDFISEYIENNVMKWNEDRFYC